MPEPGSRSVTIPTEGVELEGTLRLPTVGRGLVLFAHGSASSRHSPRNAYVANVLASHGLGTLLFDLLTEREDRAYETRFDVDLLTRRLLAVTAWLDRRAEAGESRIGYFGSSTGAAAALQAAARLGDDVGAVVSRGGRVDLAASDLPAVTAPTLFIVGGADTQVLELNRSALQHLDAPNRLEVIEGAGHLFEGSEELAAVARLAADWFERHLS